jgi:hypothetical protein
MRKFSYFLGFLLIGAVGAPLIGNLYEAEANYTLYRFAVNLAEGRGLLYGTFEGQVTTFPLAPSVLALLHRVGVEPSLGSYLINTLAVAVGALCLYLWRGQAWLGALYALLMLIQPSPLITLMLAFGLLGGLALREKRPLWSGVSLGLAMLAAPYAALIALGLAFAAAAQSWAALRRFAAPALVIPISVALLMQAAYTPTHVALPLPDWARIRFYAELDELPDGRIIGAWLAENTAPDALIAANDAALIGYHALPRRILDLDGALAPVQRDRFLMFRYAPDVVVLRDGESVGWDNFSTTYAQVFQSGTLSVYQRVVNWAALDDHGVAVNLSARFARQDLRLINVAIGRALRAGDLVRVRLDWQVQFVPRQTVEIKLNLLGADGIPIAGVIDRLPPEVWQRGGFSSYHLMVLPPNAAEGALRLFLGVDVNAASLADLQVAEVRLLP